MKLLIEVDIEIPPNFSDNTPDTICRLLKTQLMDTPSFIIRDNNGEYKEIPIKSSSINIIQ